MQSLDSLGHLMAAGLGLTSEAPAAASLVGSGRGGQPASRNTYPQQGRRCWSCAAVTTMPSSHGTVHVSPSIRVTCTMSVPSWSFQHISSSDVTGAMVPPSTCSHKWLLALLLHSQVCSGIHVRCPPCQLF